jgi:CRISPR-associated protein (TIGR03986 family)
MITAPFNFIPLNEKVFFPSWAEDISHDVPFEDGKSGVIDITITAKSPIFIRDHANAEQFCQHNGQFYIPGSSVKGMIRNVLEIMSFSKLDKHSYDDDTYAVRDLSKADNFYMSQMNQHKNTTYCGWLKKEGDSYIIEDCGIPGRISHTQINYALNIDFSSYFISSKFNANNKTQKTSEYKYNLVGGKIHKIAIGDMYKSEKNAKYDKREFYKFQKNSQRLASLILTGQPTPRQNSGKMGDGKGFEFLFFDVQKELKVDKTVIENFKFAYFDERKTEPKESPDWAYWKVKLYTGEKIPVFFQKNGSQVEHFGLSYLYKLPYKHSVKDGVNAIHFDNRADMTQTIFGYINKSSQEALKGRVQFSHFKAVENIKVLQPRKEILGTPRASYYPMYVRQHSGDFVTFMDNNFSIAGRKRYPIHNGNKTTKTEDTGNENVGTAFTPLSPNVMFKGKLRYHNLKKVELGAILSALTFHNTPNTYHNIGMAKSLGYGKVELKIEGIADISNYLKEFELIVSEQILAWKDSVQLKELLSMTVEQNNEGNSKLEYMSLENFAKNKTGNNKDYLRCYTELQSIQSISIKSLINEEDLKELDKRNQEYLIKQKEYEIQKKLKKEHDDMFEILQTTENIALIESFKSKYPASEYIEEANQLIVKIKEHAKKVKQQEAQNEANAKWETVLKVEQKFKVKALRDFIANYPDSLHVSSAQQELQSFTSSNTNNSSLDLSKFDKFKPLGKNIKKLTGGKLLNDEQKDLLEQKLLSIDDKKKNYDPSDFSSPDLLGKERAEALKEKLS